MPTDHIGRIEITPPVPALTFPLVTDYGHGRTRKRQVIVHTFGSANAKIEQRFHYGDPSVRYQFVRKTLTNPQRKQLWQFWESVQGTNLPFFYAAPNSDGTTTIKTVVFDTAPLSFEDLSDTICSTGLTFIEVPSTGPTYTINATVTRFPGGTLGTALQAQAQEIIPLVRIRVLDPLVPDIFLSDRRVKIGTIDYVPRLLRMNEPGSSSIITQNIDGSTDDLTFTFGNADRAMVQLANDTQLRWATIELRLFHVEAVNTGTILELAAGRILDWTSDSGPEFTVKASDILSALTLSSPVNSISRDCYRRYQKDGCPATGAIDLVNFRGGDPGSCDNSFNAGNGCMAHQATHSFGATYCSPQGVLLRSGHLNPLAFVVPLYSAVTNSYTGSTWYPRTSSIMDTIFGGTLPEVWHNDENHVNWGLPVPCKIAAGRDENEAYAALGIVGRGPLGAFTEPQMWTSYGADKPDTFIGTTLDGMPNHGFHTDDDGNVTSDAGTKLYGLRRIVGNDPAAEGDYFSLGRVATAAQGWFTQGSDGSKMLEIVDSLSAYNKVYAAGLAFVEVRRTKPHDDPVTLPSQHALVAMVSKGLTALAWTAPGARTTIPGCVNPVWVLVNTYLSAIGKLGADAATQETFFDVAAAIAAAIVCDTPVDVIVGDGQEPQFRFKGIISDRHATRDWIQSIGNTYLGYYNWSFGKLKVGCRINASPQSAFNSGNILFNSLTLVPIQPKFEKLTVQFNDQEYQFQPNTIDYLDRDLAARNQRIQNPLSQTFPVTSCPTKSQAARLAIGRSREEMGGAVQAEQDKARIATWKSTILALDTESGGVVSITDPDVPGGVMNFRVQSMSVNTDWSVNLNGKTVTTSMYDKEVGPTVIDVQPAPVPKEAPRDTDVSRAPNFGVEGSVLDPTVAEIAGLSFPDRANTHSVNGANFTLYYTDLLATTTFLTAALQPGDTTVHLTDESGIAEGAYLRIGHEIVRCGTPGAPDGIVPIIRAQLGTAAAYAPSGSSAARVSQKATTAYFSNDFFNADPAAPFWTLDVSLPNSLLCVVSCYATNAYGSSATTYVLAGISGAGLDLTPLSAGTNRDLVVNITNTGSPQVPYPLTAVQQVVNVTATTQDVYILLPDDELMLGLKIVLNISPGGTQAVYLRVQSGDTLEGSSVDYLDEQPSLTLEGT